MRFPKISVVTITYGHEDYIIQTIKGVLKQKYKGIIEFIISNDNSPDNTELNIFNYINSIKIPSNIQIKYINHPNNIGIMSNFYTTLKSATGEYISLCDGDDYWVDEYKIDKQVQFLENNHNFILVGHNVKIFENNTGEIIKESFPGLESKMISKDHIYLNNYIPALSLFFRNKFEIPEWLLNCEIGDYPLILFLSQFGEIGFINDVMADYRSNSGYHSSSDKERKNKLFIKSMDVVKQNVNLKRQQLNFLNYQILLMELRNMNNIEKLKAISKSSINTKLKLKAILKTIK